MSTRSIFEWWDTDHRLQKATEVYTKDHAGF
jgi:hypothetical protein